MKSNLTRRAFVRTAAAGSAALAWLGARRGPTVLAAEADKPALLGGTPVHKGGWPKWPEWRESWEPEILKVLRSGRLVQRRRRRAGAGVRGGLREIARRQTLRWPRPAARPR